MKSYSLADVVLSVQPMLGGHTRLVTAVNGVPWWFTAGLAPGRWSLAELDPEGALARAVAPDRVIGCVVNCAASMPKPGWVRHATGKRLTLGPALGQPDATLAPLAQALSQAGFEAIVSDFIQQEVWKKLLGNITLNPIGALTLSDTRQMLDDPATAALVLTVMREVQALGHALGIDTGVSAEERLAMARKLGSFRSSMLQDLESHKPLELEGLFAAVLSLAAQTQTPLPATTMLHTLARLRARATGELPGAVAS